MPFGDTVRNAMANAAAGEISHLGLADSTNTEIAGGSPAYARKAITWGGAVGGIVANTNQMDFNVQAADDVYFVHAYDAPSAGNDLGWYVAGGQAVAAATITASDDTFVSKAHGLVAADRVVVMDVGGTGLPSGLAEGTVYYVIASGLTTDAFKLSATLAGASVAITTDGEGFVVKTIPEIFGSQGVFTIAVGDAKISGTLI